MQLEDKVSSVLNFKGRGIIAVTPNTPVYDALQLMAQKDIGALLVMSGGSLEGVVSERDYARKIILKGKSSKETLVEEIMTSPAPTISLDETVDDCMRLMTTHRARHLPVMQGDAVVGILSIGDLVNWIIRAQEATIEQLHHYIAGNYPA